MSWFKRQEEPSFTSGAIATLTIIYTCGHSSISSIVSDEDETTYNSTECTDCWKASHQLLQERQSLSDFVNESLNNTNAKKRGWR